ncbi:hypothetical protein B0I37DRAFT_314639 [Chaetomium sp. MPI-CAGE-AT-0009]|nr:hypothetical protein B0I37DRAFT_314639 [Chaetomium sp. MPI-CAGE-AT-0009]
MARQHLTEEHVRTVLAPSAGVSTGLAEPTVKECVPSVTVRKRNGKRAHVSRAAQLEAKLEDLVTLLRHQAGPTDKAPPLGDTAGNVATGTPTLSSRSTMSESEESTPHSAAHVVLPPQQPNYGPEKDLQSLPPRAPLLGSVFGPPAPDPLATPKGPPSMPSCIYQPNPFEAVEDLKTFRKYMLIFLPLVHLPATMTSETLKEVYPFLWFSIMTVTCKNVDRRLVMNEAAMKFLAQKMVVDHEKSLDLLLGLIVIIGWAHYYLKKDKPILSLMASLAQSLVFDLSLNKPPSESYISSCLRTPLHPPAKEKTLEERRAVLACFLVTSQISQSIKRIDALAWTPHMDDCLQTLSQQREWEGDDLLVAQVKVQLIADQVTRAASQSADGIPPGYVRSSLRTQLQNMRAELPVHLQHNGMSTQRLLDTILSHIYYTELAIHEIAIAEPKWTFNPTVSSMQRYEAMEACLDAVRGWLDRHFSIPSYVYIGMTFSYWWNLAHCLLVLYKLSILDEPTWNRRAVRDRIDLLTALDQLGAGFDEIAARRQFDTGPTVDDDPFSRFAKMVRSMKTNWAPELATTEGNTGSSAATTAEALIDNSAEGLNVPFSFQPGDSETWLAGFSGLFDMNWDA